LTFIPNASARGAQSDRSANRGARPDSRSAQPPRRQYSTGRTPARPARAAVDDDSYESDGAVLVAGAD